MPHALADSDRYTLWFLHRQGESADTIARTLAIDVRTVYRLLRRFHLADGPTFAAYAHCGRQRSHDSEILYQQATALRRLHPTWGAGRILAELSLSRPPALLPTRSTVKRWLVQAGLAPLRPPLRPPAPRASFPHQIWQMDACEMIPLADGSRVSWLRVIDEASGAVLLTRVFPCAHWNEVGKQPVQTFLRDSFYRWGLPQGMRVDHGRPWVSSWGLPSDLELWLAGLAVALHMIRVRCPEDNGTIERSQGTGKRWAEPQCCASPQHLQQRLDEEDRVQREVYRDDQGQTRRERFPGLLNSGRGYAPLWEKYHWDMQAALACLAAHPVKRKVNKQGQVSVYDHHHRVGRDYAEQEVEVRFDTASQQWCFLVGETAVGKCPAFQISQEKIVGLELGSRQGRSARLTAAKKAAEKTNKGP